MQKAFAKKYANIMSDFTVEKFVYEFHLSRLQRVLSNTYNTPNPNIDNAECTGVLW